MDNSGVLNLAFFFGAGAEVDFGLPSGKEFLNNTLLCNDFKNKYGRHLKNHFGKKKYFHSYNYSQYHINTEKNIFKIMLENLLYKKYESRALKDFKEAEKQVFKKKSFEGFKKIITGEITDYKEIENVSPKLAEVLSDYKNDLSQIFTVSSAGVLDKYFPSIANPNKFPSQNFSKIFNYYWNCYFLLVEKITESLNKKGILGYSLKHNFMVQNAKQEQLDFSKILAQPDYFTNLLYLHKPKIAVSYPDSYYSRIKAYIDAESRYECSGIATTNYFCFSEILSQNVIYLNGMLKLFEFPESIEVRNLRNIKESWAERTELYFPFIFGQSYTKPIVCDFQTEAFHQLQKLLHKSDVLVVLGYNFNEDDNHVNSFIHSFVSSGKKLVFVTDNDEAKCRLEILQKLRLAKEFEGNIVPVKVSYGDNQQVVAKIFGVLKHL